MYIRVPVPIDHTMGESASLIERGSMGSLTGLGQAPTPLIHCGVDMDDVDVKLRVFIPPPAVSLPVPGWYDITGGDNRGYSYNQGSSRAQIHACVRLPSAGRPAGLTILKPATGWEPTTAYPSNAAIPIKGLPAWCVRIKPGITPAAIDKVQLTSNNLKIAIGGTSLQNNVLALTSKSTVYSMHVDGSNPLIKVAPAINADLNLFLKRVGSVLSCLVIGDHDGFPAYELYVDGVRIYCYDPIAAGKSPASLFGQGDIKVNTGWIDIQLDTGLTSGGQICRSSIPIAKP